MSDEQHTPIDGDPISQFTLGGRYLSEDMYRDYPGLKAGDLVAVEIGGVVYTDYIENMTGRAPIYPRLPWWRRVARSLTPKRWRKPLQPIRVDPVARQQRMLQNVINAIDGLTQ